MAIKTIEELQSLFVPPEETPARIRFGNPPNMPGFEEAKVAVYGVCFDDTASFGKGGERGPEALRHTSARQIETYVQDFGADIYEGVPVYDLGDFKIQKMLNPEEKKLLYSEDASLSERMPVIKKVSEIIKQFDVLKEVTQFISSQGKIPFLLGGEHTLSYWPLAALAAGDKSSNQGIVVLHFDAHRDAKESYMDVPFCHTTPMFHFLKEFGKKHQVDFIQIGIRQAGKDEEEFCNAKGVKTFYPKDLRENFKGVKKFVTEKTKGRNVYVTFDIDALDICYTPCTGTPEPFGMTPEQAVELFYAIDKSAKLVGADLVEVSVKNEDYREGTIGAQLILRLLWHCLL